MLVPKQKFELLFKMGQRFLKINKKLGNHNLNITILNKNVLAPYILIRMSDNNELCV